MRFVVLVMAVTLTFGSQLFTLSPGGRGLGEGFVFHSMISKSLARMKPLRNNGLLGGKRLRHEKTQGMCLGIRHARLTGRLPERARWYRIVQEIDFR